MLAVSVSAAEPDEGWSEDGIRFTLATYLWMPSFEGEVGVGGTPVRIVAIPVDVGFPDYADNLNMALSRLPPRLRATTTGTDACQSQFRREWT
jgi:hypothetical protein